MNKEILEKYNLNKLGVHNNKTKQCLCGKDMDVSEKNCPFCNTKLNKSSLLNISKSGTLARRFETVINGDKITLNYYHLLSNAFELYETKMVQVDIDKNNSSILISDHKLYKMISQKEDVIKFFDDNLPGFRNYANQCLTQLKYDYAISNFGSLSSTQLSNILNVYLNYNALIPFLREYKVLYYGSMINLNKYYPMINFNDPEDIKKCNVDWNLLLTWDIKNQKYIETIFEISKNASSTQLEILDGIIDTMTQKANDTSRNSINYNDIIETFSILYNKDIPLEDFIRIHNNSHDNYFCHFNQFIKNYQKYVSKKIDWESINGLDKKTIESLKVKVNLVKYTTLKKAKVEELYELVNDNPLEALKMLSTVVKHN